MNLKVFLSLIISAVTLSGDSSIGIIGGADGPTAIMVSGDSSFLLFTAAAVAVIAVIIILIFILKRRNKNK